MFVFKKIEMIKNTCFDVLFTFYNCTNKKERHYFRIQYIMFALHFVVFLNISTLNENHFIYSFDVYAYIEDDRKNVNRKISKSVRSHLFCEC